MKTDISARTLFNVLFQISRFGLAALFLFAVGAKLFTIRDFAANLSNLVAPKLIWPATIVVIVSEFATAVLLLRLATARLGAALAAILLAGFAAYALFYVYVLQGEPLECGCFGRLIGSQLGLTTALRNLALLVPAAIIFFGLPSVRSMRSVQHEFNTIRSSSNA